MARYGHIRYLRTQGDAFLRYLLFTEEVPITSPIEGDVSYARWFGSLGPFDKKGRSLRDLDLRTRLFKHPCSYMIYSPSFESLPQRAKRHLYRRLWEVLSGEDVSAPFNTLVPEARTAVREILVQTKKDLPALPGSPRSRQSQTRQTRNSWSTQMKMVLPLRAAWLVFWPLKQT